MKLQNKLSLFFAAFISVFFLGFLTASFAQEKIELKVSHFWPPTSYQHELLMRWKDKLENESKGRLTLRIFPGGTLLKQTIEWEGLNKGVADIVYGVRLETAGRELSTKMTIFTFGARTASVGANIAYDIYNQFQEYRDEWKTVKLLWLAAAGPNQIHTRIKPVRRLEDLKGLQLRTAPGAGIDLVKTLGASPVTMPMSEVYMAIQKGTVDGCLGPADILKGFRLDDVTKYTTNVYLWVLLGHYVAMNKDSYNNLPPDLRKVIDSTIQWGKEETGKMYDRIDEESINYARQKGHIFIDPNPEEMKKWASAIRSLQDKIASELDAKGYPGTKLKDFIIQRVKYYRGEK